MKASGHLRYQHYFTSQNSLLFGIELHGMEGVVLVSGEHTEWKAWCWWVVSTRNGRRGAGEHTEWKAWCWWAHGMGGASTFTNGMQSQANKSKVPSFQLTNILGGSVIWQQRTDRMGYVHTFMHTYIHTHTHIHTYTHTYIHTYLYTHIHTYIYTYVRIYIHTHIHTYIHTYILIYTHTYRHTYIHTALKIIYTGAILPLLLYGAPVWKKAMD